MGDARVLLGEAFIDGDRSGNILFRLPESLNLPERLMFSQSFAIIFVVVSSSSEVLRFFSNFSFIFYLIIRYLEFLSWIYSAFMADLYNFTIRMILNNFTILTALMAALEALDWAATWLKLCELVSLEA